MLEIRPTCENCNKSLPFDAQDAMICTFECTFCQDCVEGVLNEICPNCGGKFEKRPIRPANLLEKYPVSTKVVYKPVVQQNNTEYELAEINIARMKGVNIDDPIMKEFVDNLDAVNKLAENSDGFVWRLKDESNNATNLNPYNDEQIIINISVWESIETLGNYVYKTFHTDFLKRRKEWFHTYGKAHTAMWWIPKGKYPTMQEAVDKLDYLQKNGASKEVFNFRKKFPKPE